MDITIQKLHLLTPLRYRQDRELRPFAYQGDAGETLFQFELNPDQYLSIEPDIDQYLGALIASGSLAASSLAASNLAASSRAGNSLELPAGEYLFAQIREALDREESVLLAVEVQKDGLWERFSLGSGLYVRYLFEDGKPVTQVFRPLAGPAATL
ncbi:hypothetical protein FACS189444_5710 [Spirochaetia bacterium]|nr:hypothetical protein FACS189444_5710 [Spirochaetia bacterium]